MLFFLFNCFFQNSKKNQFFGIFQLKTAVLNSQVSKKSAVKTKKKLKFYLTQQIMLFRTAMLLFLKFAILLYSNKFKQSPKLLFIQLPIENNGIFKQKSVNKQTNKKQMAEHFCKINIKSQFQSILSLFKLFSIFRAFLPFKS